MIIKTGDRLFLWVIGVTSLVLHNINDLVVVACILSLAVVSFWLALGDRIYMKYVYEALVSIFLLISIVYGEFTFFLPLMLYEIFDNKQIVAAVIYMCSFINYIYEYQGPGRITYIVLFSMLAVFMQYKTDKNIELKDGLKKMRDDAKEHDILMENKNRELIAEQDYEIHLATLAERNRIAREIHDNVGHMLTRAILLTGAITTLEKEKIVKDQLNNLSDTLNTAMDNIRQSVHDLHDDSINLKSAVSEVAEAFSGFRINFEYNMSENVDKDIKLCYIAITKEALNNAAKYSNGDKVDIIMREQPGFYQLIIADNGTNIPENLTGGIGIINMKQRVKRLGGSLNINTSNGFRINISIMK